MRFVSPRKECEAWGPTTAAFQSGERPAGAFQAGVCSGCGRDFSLSRQSRLRGKTKAWSGNVSRAGFNVRLKRFNVIRRMRSSSTGSVRSSHPHM